MNESAKEHWTDGRHVESLAPQGEGLRRCSCGSYFLLREVEYVGEVPQRTPRAPPDWESDAPLDLDLVPGMTSRLWYEKWFDTRPAAEIDAEEALIPPLAIPVDDAELAGIIEAGTATDSVVFATRKLYWRNLNDGYRDRYRAHIAKHPRKVLTYAPSPEQIENMQTLLLLAESRDKPDWIEMAELHRELGMFEKAASYLDRGLPDQQEFVTLLGELIENRIQGPVRYSFDWDNLSRGW